MNKCVLILMHIFFFQISVFIYPGKGYLGVTILGRYVLNKYSFILKKIS